MPALPAQPAVPAKPAAAQPAAPSVPAAPAAPQGAGNVPGQYGAPTYVPPAGGYGYPPYGSGYR